MGKGITHGDLAIGYCHIKERKKPCIVVREGNKGYVLGTFKTEADAEFFINKLAEFVGIENEQIGGE